MYVMYYTQFTSTTHEINVLRFPIATRVTCSGIIYIYYRRYRLVQIHDHRQTVYYVLVSPSKLRFYYKSLS